MAELVYVEYAMSDVRFPDMRAELIRGLTHLADRSYQSRVWVEHRYPSSGYYDDLSTTYEILADLGVLGNPMKTVGEVLKNVDEVSAVRQLANAFDLLFARYGTDRSDVEYLNSPEWDEVVRSAEHAREIVASDE